MSARCGNVVEKDLESYARVIADEMGYDVPEAVSYLSSKLLSDMLKITVDGMPVGFANIVVKSEIFYINDLDVVKESRRHGHGSTLLRHIERKARMRGCGKVRLHVNTDNKVALKFYMKNEYDNVSRIKGFYAKGCDAYLLEKDLS